MKAFMIIDENARPKAVAEDESIAEHLMFSMAEAQGLVDQEEGTFDFGGLSILDVDLTALKESMLLTEEEILQLEEDGAILI